MPAPASEPVLTLVTAHTATLLSPLQLPPPAASYRAGGWPATEDGSQPAELRAPSPPAPIVPSRRVAAQRTPMPPIAGYNGPPSRQALSEG